MKLHTLAFGVMGGLVPAAASLTRDERGPSHREPLVIAHRGASSYLLEHVLAAYELAIDQGPTSSSGTS
jgi:glycerophosphoryl diester phosphodiesterase